MISQEDWDYLINAPRYSEIFGASVGTTPIQVLGASPKRVHCRFSQSSANLGVCGPGIPGNILAPFKVGTNAPDAEFEITLHGLAIQQPWFASTNTAATLWGIIDTVVP